MGGRQALYGIFASVNAISVSQSFIGLHILRSGGPNGFMPASRFDTVYPGEVWATAKPGYDQYFDIVQGVHCGPDGAVLVFVLRVRQLTGSQTVTTAGRFGYPRTMASLGTRVGIPILTMRVLRRFLLIAQPSLNPLKRRARTFFFRITKCRLMLPRLAFGVWSSFDTTTEMLGMVHDPRSRRSS